MIADGTLKPGDVVPPSAVLHEQTGIGQTSCLRGLRLLAVEGVLRPRRTDRGKLWIVCDPVQERPGADFRWGRDRHRAPGVCA
jgi:DNA-binding FadR family transcriptional regulator